eukprot:3934286-Rhodomonas_salina.3
MVRVVVWGQASAGFRNVGILVTICTEEARLLGQRSSRPGRTVLNVLGPDEVSGPGLEHHICEVQLALLSFARMAVRTPPRLLPSAHATLASFLFRRRYALPAPAASSVSTQSDSKRSAEASRRRRWHKEESDWSQRLSQMWRKEARRLSLLAQLLAQLLARLLAQLLASC